MNFLENSFSNNNSALSSFANSSWTKMATSQNILPLIDQAVQEYNHTNASSTIHSVRGSNLNYFFICLSSLYYVVLLFII
jgi:hypothetical protein